jgi:outer membrane protein assembly factor BamB
MYQLEPDHNPVVSGPASPAQGQTQLGGKVNGGLATDGSLLFVESFDRRVQALDMRTGAVRWSTRVPNVVMTTPIVADDVAAVGTGTAHVLIDRKGRTVWGRPAGDALIGIDERTGRIRWTVPTVGEDMPSPALARVNGTDALVFVNGDDRVRAVAMSSGKTLWLHPVEGLASMSSAARSGGLVFVVVGGGPYSGIPVRTLAVDAATGRIAWSAPAGNADCSPTLGGGEVFVEGSEVDTGRMGTGGIYNTVTALDARTGRQLWTWASHDGTITNAGSNEQAIAGLYADGAFYESIPATDEFIAFDARTGHIRWRAHTGGEVKMSAVEVNRRLYFGDTSGNFYVVGARSGRIISRKHFDHIFTVSPPLIAGNTMYVANDNVVRAMPLSSFGGG